MPTYNDAERERHNSVINMLRDESDRGTVLVGSAFLDDLLRELLVAFFIDPATLESAKEKDGYRNMFNPNGLAGSFSNRINLAYALGLVSKRDYEDMHRVRDIRNDFAHKLQYVSFADPSVCGRCDHFAIIRDIEDSGFTSFTDFNTPRRRFIWTLSILYGRLTNRTKLSEHRITPASRRVQMLNSRRLREGISQPTIFGPDDETIFLDEDEKAGSEF